MTDRFAVLSTRARAKMKAEAGWEPTHENLEALVRDDLPLLTVVSEADDEVDDGDFERICDLVQQLYADLNPKRTSQI